MRYYLILGDENVAVNDEDNADNAYEVQGIEINLGGGRVSYSGQADIEITVIGETAKIFEEDYKILKSCC